MHGLPFCRRVDRGVQGFVTIDDRLQSGVQFGHVERAAEFECGRLVVSTGGFGNRRGQQAKAALGGEERERGRCFREVLPQLIEIRQAREDGFWIDSEVEEAADFIDASDEARWRFDPPSSVEVHRPSRP